MCGFWQSRFQGRSYTSNRGLLLGASTKCPLAAAADVEAAAVELGLEDVAAAAGAATVATLDPPAAVLATMMSGMGSILIGVEFDFSMSSTAVADVVAVAQPFALASCKVKAAWLLSASEEHVETGAVEDAPAVAANCCCNKMWLGIVERFCFDCSCPPVVNMATPS